MKCKACNDTGVNSKGGACVPCALSLKGTLTDALGRLFAQSFLPSEEQVVEAVETAHQQFFADRSLFAIGGKNAEGKLAWHWLPTHHFHELLNANPREYETGEKVFILEFLPDGRKKAIARWKNGKWQMRKPGE